MIAEYDIELEDPAARRTFEWRTTMVPRADTKLLISERKVCRKKA